MTTATESPAPAAAEEPEPETGVRRAVALVGRQHPGLERLVGVVCANRFLLAVMGAFVVAALIVPTLAPVATTDDWAYARSSQILLAEGRLVIFPVVAATAVFQVAWGAFFGWLFGPELGVFRLSTVVMVGLGGLCLFALCRLLGVDRGRSALGVATYLFNPLAFVLAFTFMTDPHFATLLIVATACYARGLATDRLASWAMLAGSAAAASAFLTRQQGALIPPAVVAFLILSGRLRWDRAGAATLLRVVGLPLVVLVGYGVWLRAFNEVPDVQESFFRDALEEGWSGTWWLVRRVTVIQLVYAGLFLLPLVLAIAPAGRRLWAGLARRAWLIAAIWAGGLLAGASWFWVNGGRMPYASQFFGRGGLGAPDVLGSRPIVIPRNLLDWMTLASIFGGLVLALVVARGVAAPGTLQLARAGLVLAVGLGQCAGVLPPSYHYIGRSAGTLDRYLLPLLPLAIALSLWAVKEIDAPPHLGWLVVACFAVFAVAGTRDYLVFMRAVWGVAHDANAAGVANTKLDAGSGWDGYRLYEQSVAEGIGRARSPKGSPWWVYFYAKATDSSYVVASKPLRGFEVVWERGYSQWLSRGPTRVYLLRRPTAPWPPAVVPSEQAGLPGSRGD